MSGTNNFYTKGTVKTTDDASVSKPKNIKVGYNQTKPKTKLVDKKDHNSKPIDSERSSKPVVKGTTEKKATSGHVSKPEPNESNEKTSDVEQKEDNVKETSDLDTNTAIDNFFERIGLAVAIDGPNEGTQALFKDGANATFFNVKLSKIKKTEETEDTPSTSLNFKIWFSGPKDSLSEEEVKDILKNDLKMCNLQKNDWADELGLAINNKDESSDKIYSGYRNLLNSLGNIIGKDGVDSLLDISSED